MIPFQQSFWKGFEQGHTCAGPYAVVMAPTRELAQQIEDETVKFAHFLVRLLVTGLKYLYLIMYICFTSVLFVSVFSHCNQAFVQLLTCR